MAPSRQQRYGTPETLTTEPQNTCLSPDPTTDVTPETLADSNSPANT